MLVVPGTPRGGIPGEHRGTNCLFAPNIAAAVDQSLGSDRPWPRLGELACILSNEYDAGKLGHIEFRRHKKIDSTKCRHRSASSRQSVRAKVSSLSTVRCEVKRWRPTR